MNAHYFVIIIAIIPITVLGSYYALHYFYLPVLYITLRIL